MSDRFSAGDRVRVRADDPPVHHRAPRYVRGRSGVVVEPEGRHALPDDVVAGREDPQPRMVYAVRFAAADLWGAGDHAVTVDLWEPYLEPDEP